MTYDSALREALRHASIREIEETFEALGPQLLMEDRPLGSAVPVTPGCGPDIPWRPSWGGRGVA